MNNSKKYLFLIVMILFVVIGVSLAYFGITIIGNDTAKGNNVVTGNLELTFNDTNELIFNGAFPGDYITKTISVKNTGTKEVSYNLVWTKLTNEITNNELVIEATCKRLNSSGVEEGTCNSISQTPISDTTIKKNISIEPSVTHEYNITITFIDTGKPQNYNKNKTFEGKLGINESAVKTVYCTFNGELKQGAEYVKGKFTYHYKEKGYDDNTNRVWSKISDDGWGVMLTLPTSTAPIDASEICTYINDKPIVSMSGTFYTSKATSINLSKLDTSNVIYMDSMFIVSHATTLDLSNFDTSNVTDMHSMFASSQATTIDLSSFNTSNVTKMTRMFQYSEATTLDLSSFDTSNVTYMDQMFNSTKNLKTIYVSDKFKTDSVTTSTDMFTDSTNLIGGVGTVYDANNVDKTYARIDGGTSSPGYFTEKPSDSKSFSSDSWTTIAYAVRTNNLSKYKIGDTKAIDMGTYGTHTLRIANTSTPSECSGTGFSQTACGFVLEFADIITTHKMNNSNPNKGGWPVTRMRTFVNNDIYNAIPSELRNVIIDTMVVSGHGRNDTSNFTSTDKLYLLSPAEIWAQGTSNTVNYDTARDVTRQLDYYKNLGTSTSNYSGAIKKNGTDADFWWLRSAHSDYGNAFFNVRSNGECGSDYSYDTYGVSTAFRLG